MSSRTPHPHAERLAHPDVMAKIRSVIPRRLQAADQDDIAQGALIRLFVLDVLPESMRPKMMAESARAWYRL